MTGVDRSGRGAAKERPRAGALAEAISLALGHASDQEIRGFLGKILRAGSLPSRRAARILGVSRSQHFEDVKVGLAMPGLEGPESAA